MDYNHKISLYWLVTDTQVVCTISKSPSALSWCTSQPVCSKLQKSIAGNICLLLGWTETLPFWFEGSWWQLNALQSSLCCQFIPYVQSLWCMLLLLLLLKSVEVDDDVALLLSCTVLGSMCTQVTLQSKLGGTGSAAVRTLWTCLWFCCGRMTHGSTFLGGSEPVTREVC